MRDLEKKLEILSFINGDYKEDMEDMSQSMSKQIKAIDGIDIPEEIMFCIVSSALCTLFEQEKIVFKNRKEVGE